MANPSPALTGLPALYGADIYANDSTQKFGFGYIGYAYGGNKVYRYVEVGGTATVAGSLYVAATIVANHVNIAVSAAVAVDGLQVKPTLGATLSAANDYAEGEMAVNDAAGEGISYRVIGNKGVAASAVETVNLDESIQVALTTASEVSLVKNNWKDVVVSVSDQADMAVGVANKIITADYFGWLQTRGLCAALADETLNVGRALTIGASVGGAFEEIDTDDVYPQYAVAQQAGVDTEERLIYLTID